VTGSGGGGVASGGAPGSGGAVTSGGASGTGGGAASGGTSGAGGTSASDTGGSSASGGAVSTGGSDTGGGAGTGGPPASGGAGGGPTDPMLAKFSFFVTSLPALVALSGKAEGFGGDLRFGKADGLSGADEICRQVAERGLPGAGQKQWRALLSATTGPGGVPVHARDRIGPGPWHDRMGRLLASDLTSLFRDRRPGGDAGLANDMTTENGDPNHYVGPAGFGTVGFRNMETLTGTDNSGRLKINHGAEDTCGDWTNTTGRGLTTAGHSWSIFPSGQLSWLDASVIRGCAAGVDPSLGGTGGTDCVGCSGGYGGFYCFALP
jgi:hypothetical protein